MNRKIWAFAALVVIALLSVAIARQGSGSAVSVIEGTYVSGNLSSLSSSDDSYYIVQSAQIAPDGTQSAQVHLESSNASLAGAGGGSLKFECNGDTRAAVLVFAYNWSTSSYVHIKSVNLEATDITNTVVLTQAQAASYFNASGQARFRLRAFKGGGLNPIPSFPYKVDFASLAPLPAGPTNLTATALSGTQINLTWADNSTIESGYHLERKGGASGTTYVTVADLPPNTTTYADGLLSFQTTYTYRVRAFTTEGNSPWSNEASATTLSSSGSPEYCAAHATSASTMRVYWEPVTNATAYKIYRATTSGGYNFNAPVGTVNVVTGTEHVFDDSGLTNGQSYYYVVKAVVGGTESSPSPEDTHFPNSDAIPWNSTRTNILNAVLATQGTEPDLPFAVPAGNTQIMSPDGLIYQDGSNSTVAPSPVTVDSVNWRMIVGLSGQPAFDMPLAEGNYVEVTQQPASALPAGGFRRVITPEDRFSGTSGYVYLPVFNSTNFNVKTPTETSGAGYKEQAYAYTGCSAVGFEVDAGISLYPPHLLPDGTTLPWRWQGFINVADGNFRKTGAPFPVKLGDRAFTRLDGRPYIDAASIIGNDVFLGFYVNPRNRLSRLYVFAVDQGGLYVANAINAAVKVPGANGTPLRLLRMKRVVSLAQSLNINGSAYAGRSSFTNPLPGFGPEGKFWYDDNAYVKGVVWKNARLYTATAAVPWPETLNGGRPGDNHLTLPTTTKTGSQETANGERVEIQH